MTFSMTRILRIRGKDNYLDGLTKIRIASEGRREGASLFFKEKAQKLLSFHDQLDENQIHIVKTWLGSGRCQSMEEALTLMEGRINRKPECL